MTAAAPLEGAVYRTQKGAKIHLRSCRGLAELEACVDLQRLVWGYPDIEITPRKAFLLAQELGGQVIGAFEDSGRLVGMAMAMAALEAGSPDESPRPYLHSHMLAVRPEYRNQGLGARLKLVQREDALSRGIGRMTWTFDPLAGKNAYLNLHRLGAVARRYSPDFYGVSSSRLQGGLPTDRLHADWWLGSARVEACIRVITGDQREADAQDLTQHVSRHVLQTTKDSGTPHPHVEPRLDGDPPIRQTIVLPQELEQWKQDPSAFEKVKAVQEANRTLFLDAFARGLAVTDFYRDTSGNGVFSLASLATDSSITPSHQPVEGAYED